jgi:putative N6-adenine-specific DNA methylase
VRMKLSDKSTILVTCQTGLGCILEEEMKELGYTPLNVRDTGVEIEGNFFDAMDLNLRLRCGYAVLYLLKAFDCRDADELYTQVYAQPWEDIIPTNEYLSIISRVDNPTINNSMFPNLKIKDAVADRLTNKLGSRCDSGSGRDNIVINLYWKGTNAWLYINTTGRKLSDRGYRKMPHLAPMQETLVAACLRAAGYTSDNPIVCPMCGSGTFAIEAALIALNRCPGLLRSNYAFMHLMNFESQLWQEMRAEARDEADNNKRPIIIASDIDPKAVEAAQKNALTAGVDHIIKFEVCDFADTAMPDEPGMIIMNPEYGNRLGDSRKLEDTYARIGDFFKQKCPGWTGYIFTGNMDLAKKVGLRTSRRIPFYNADIECRLLKYEMYQGSRKSKYDKQQA